MSRVNARTTMTLVLVGCALLMAGCDDPKAQTGAGAPGSTPQAGAPAAGGEALPAGLMVAQAPADAKGVAEVRGAGEDGAEVVVRGRIAGSEEPFTSGRAQFQLVDMAIKSCAEMEGDACLTPWDMCCEEKGTVVQNSVTVQVVGADGRPLKSELKGVGGLKPLSEVSVKGKLHKSADGKVVTVNATELYVKQG
jgi:hypothetical protein